MNAKVWNVGRMGRAPDRGQNVAMGHHGARMVGEKCEQFEFLGGQSDLFARSLDAMAEIVDLEIRDPHHDRF